MTQIFRSDVPAVGSEPAASISESTGSQPVSARVFSKQGRIFRFLEQNGEEVRTAGTVGYVGSSRRDAMGSRGEGASSEPTLEHWWGMRRSAP